MMTETRRELLKTLIAVQNEEWNQHRDIVTITGFMSDDEVREHIARYQHKPVTAKR